MENFISLRKSDIIRLYRLSEADTGSVEVQVAILQHKVLLLNQHLKSYRKDHSSAMGLARILGKRKKFLKYLKSRNIERYQTLISKLEIRG